LPSGKVPITTVPPQASTSEVITSAFVSASTVTAPPESFSNFPSLPVPSNTEPSRIGKADQMAVPCSTGTEPRLNPARTWPAESTATPFRSPPLKSEDFSSEKWRVPTAEAWAAKTKPIPTSE
jgi:hypothetical protein